MSLIIPPGFGLASFVLTGSPGTQPYVTTLGVDLSAVGGDFVAAADQLGILYGAAFTSETNNDLDLDRVTLYIGSDGGSGSVDSSFNPIAMSNAGDYGPTAMSVIARKQSNDLGRRGRGRMFLPGTALEAGVNEDGSLTSGLQTGISAALSYFYDELIAPTTTGDVALPPVLFHSSAPADPTPITGFSVAPLVGWIRGRIR